jgi:hypothetical protein
MVAPLSTGAPVAVALPGIVGAGAPTFIGVGCAIGVGIAAGATGERMPGAGAPPSIGAIVAMRTPH